MHRPRGYSRVLDERVSIRGFRYADKVGHSTNDHHGFRYADKVGYSTGARLLNPRSASREAGSAGDKVSADSDSRFFSCITGMLGRFYVSHVSLEHNWI